MLYGENNLTKDLSVFYNNCPIHDISHTEKIYYENFNENIYDKYIINNIIGSGSIGQVYKITNIKSKKEYAMKILHPNVDEEFIIFSIFLYIFILFTKCFLNIKNSDSKTFIKNLGNQIDYNIESLNCTKICNLYKNNKFINIPLIYKCSKNIIIMDLLNMDNYVENSTQISIKKYKCLLLLLIFINNNCMNNLSHGDMHSGNWSIDYNIDENYPIINIIDFGFCFNIDINDYKNIDVFLDNPYKLVNINNLINYLCKEKKYNIDEISNDLYIKMKNSINLETHINILFSVIIKYNIKISISVINLFFIFYQLSSEYNFLINKKIHNNIDNMDNIDSSIKLELVNICDYYNIDNDYTLYLNKFTTKLCLFKKNENYNKYLHLIK
tara:strand:- start:472 stop:1623 length:1152 start_codon:yes stop_codon:yes gene_type:complete